jgi:phosphatidylglycerol:prolipoprotein diacylglycerol transferase
MTVYPFIIHLGPLEITGYGLMMMVAFLVAGWLLAVELRRRGFAEDYAADSVAAAVIGGIIGAKIWYAVLTQDAGALLSRGGMVWYGGFIGGAAAVALNGWRLGVPIRWTAHLVAPVLALGYALGRIGCFLVNDDYGRPTDLPWGMKFPEGLPPSTAANLQQLFGVAVPPGTEPSTVLAVHPTQIYEAVIMLIAFAVLWRLRTAARPVGWLFGLYLVFAGAERFLIEFVRAKDDRFLGPFTVAQLTSFLLVVIGIWIMVQLRRGDSPLPGSYLQAGKNQPVSKAQTAT